jgi:branched-chain amino acid transport system substrate-binding protein
MTHKGKTRGDRIVSRRRMIQSVGTTGAVMLAGCSSGLNTGDDGGSGSTTTTTESSKKQEEKVTADAGSGAAVKIGSPLPLTGQFAPSGKDNKAAINMAIEDFTAGRENLEGNPAYVPKGKPEHIGSINVLFRDTQLDAAVGTRKMRQLIENNNVNAIIGGVSTSVTIGMTDIAEKKKMLTVLTGTGNTQVTGEKRGKYHFRTYLNAHVTGQTLAKHLVKKENKKKWFIIYSDYGWGHDIRDNAQSVVKNNGGEIVGTAPVPFGETDFSSSLTKMQNSGADMGLLGVFDLDAVNALKQANQFGLKSKMDLAVPIHTVPQSKGLTQSALSGVWGTLKYYFTFDNENNYNFVNRFHKKYGRVPSSEATAGYKSAMEVLKAMERAKSTDSGKVVSELEGAKFTYFKGSEEYYRECDHQCIQPDNIGRGYKKNPELSSKLPSVDFPLLENVKQFKEESIFRKCSELPGSMP